MAWAAAIPAIAGAAASFMGGKGDTESTGTENWLPQFTPEGQQLLSGLSGQGALNPRVSQFLSGILTRPGQLGEGHQNMLDLSRQGFGQRMGETMARARSGKARRMPIGSQQILSTQMARGLNQDQSEFEGRLFLDNLAQQLQTSQMMDNRSFTNRDSQMQLLSLLAGRRGKVTQGSPGATTMQRIGHGLQTGASIYGAMQ